MKLRILVTSVLISALPGWTQKPIQLVELATGKKTEIDKTRRFAFSGKPAAPSSASAPAGAGGQ